MTHYTWVCWGGSPSTKSVLEKFVGILKVFHFRFLGQFLWRHLNLNSSYNQVFVSNCLSYISLGLLYMHIVGMQPHLGVPQTSSHLFYFHFATQGLNCICAFAVLHLNDKTHMFNSFICPGCTMYVLTVLNYYWYNCVSACLLRHSLHQIKQ